MARRGELKAAADAFEDRLDENSALSQRARDLGVSQGEIGDAQDAADTKQALVALVRRAAGGAGDYHNGKSVPRMKGMLGEGEARRGAQAERAVPDLAEADLTTRSADRLARRQHVNRRS